MTKLIAFEGPDCVGKTTQVHELEARLRSEGYTVSSHKIPFQDSYLYPSKIISEMIEKELVNDFPLIFQASMIENRKYFQRWILDKATEDFILVDRWNLSTLFYGEEQGISSQITSKLLEGLIEPEIYIIFDGAPFDRESKDILDRDIDLQQKLREKYENHIGDKVFHIHANKPLLEVSNRIWRLVQQTFIPQNPCPSCNKGKLIFKNKTEDLEIQGKMIQVETLAWWCNSCEEGVLNSKELQASEK